MLQNITPFRSSVFWIVILLVALSAQAQTDLTVDVSPTVQTAADSLQSSTGKRSLWKRTLGLVNSVKHKMNEVDLAYCEPRLYRGQLKMMDRIMYEELYMSADDGTKIKMYSHPANYVGPGIVFSPIGLSLKFDVSKQKYNDIDGVTDRQKMEFGVNFYSQLFYADLFYRKTGGDFSFSNYTIPGTNEINEVLARYGESPMDFGKDNDSFGMTKIDWFGGDINFLLNHKKFSMPAAYMGNGRQLRSVGSPILGVGYSHRRIVSQVCDLTSLLAIMLYLSVEADAESEKPVYTPEDRELLKAAIDKSYLCMLPSRMVFNDYHISLGYSYNWVPAQNWLINGTLMVQPAIKTAHLDNNTSLAMEVLAASDKPEDIELYKQHRMDTHKTLRDYNAIGRLSVVWNKNRWKVGANGVYNMQRFHASPVHVTNSLWSANVYVGYSFWDIHKPIKIGKKKKG